MAQALPWENDPIIQQPLAQPQGGGSRIRPITAPRPDQPSAQTEAQRRADAARAAAAEQGLPQSDTGGVNEARESAMRQEYTRNPSVARFIDSAPILTSMRGAGSGGAGDYQIIAGYAKIMDPTGSVREGDVTTISQTPGLSEWARGQIQAVAEGQALTEVSRQRLIREAATRVRSYSDDYTRVRRDFEAAARRSNFDLQTVVGTDPRPVRYYRQRADGTREYVATQAGPGQPRQPITDGRYHRAPDEEFQFYDEQEDQDPGDYTDEDRRRIEQYIRDGHSVEEVQAFVQGVGRDRNIPAISNLREVMDYYRETGQMPGWSARPAPDISDRRGEGGAIETADATVRGAADTATLGFADEGAALLGATTDFLSGDGFNYTDNLREERAVDRYDAENHFIVRTVGQVAGGLAMPTNVVNVSRSAASTALRTGASRVEAVRAARQAAARQLGNEGAAYGVAYGAGSGEGGTLGERALDSVANMVVDGLTGKLVGHGLGRAGLGTPRIPREGEAPPLVDPVTGRVNEPLETVSPAERVAAAQEHRIDLPGGAAGARPAAIIEKGLDTVPGSAGVMEDARRVTERQVESAVERVARRYGQTRGLDPAGQAAQRGARNWISRFDEVSSKAYEAIPIRPTANADLTNTRAALARLTETFQSNPAMAEAFRNSRLLGYREALDPNAADPLVRAADALEEAARSIDPSVVTNGPRAGGLSWEDLKGLRSRIGYEIGEARFSDSPTRDELRALYAALSEDMRATAQAQGPRALRAFDRANTLYRQGQERIDNALVRILGDDSRNNPEAAARAIQNISRSGTASADIRQLGEIRASLVKNGEWDAIAGALIRLGGQPANSEGRQFSPETFIRWYSDMSEPARNILFSDRGRNSLRANLDSFVEVNQRLARTSALRNTSNTAPVITGAGAVGSLGAAVANPLLGLKLASGMGAAYGMARLWTNPGFVRWATGYSKMLTRAVATGEAPDPAALRGQREYLTRMARSSPGIAAEINDVAGQLFGREQAEQPPAR